MEFDPSAEVSSCSGHALLFITEFLISADLEVIDDFTIGQSRKARTRVMLHHSFLADRSPHEHEIHSLDFRRVLISDIRHHAG